MPGESPAFFLDKMGLILDKMGQKMSKKVSKMAKKCLKLDTFFLLYNEKWAL